MAMGKLYGVSLGPGDPGLITRRAWQLLHHKAVWTYPVRNAKSESYALSIAHAAGLTAPQENTALIFPMTHDVEILAKYWLRAAHRVLNYLQRGDDVAFLVEGDASTYSTFQHLARAVAALDENAQIETIPGVSSFHAAAARLGMPFADVDDTVAIVPAGYGIPMLQRLLHDFDTLVLLKVKPLLNEIIAFLHSNDLLQHSRFIEKAGSGAERIVVDVASLRDQKVNYLSLLLVKNPHRQRGALARGCRPKVQEETNEYS